MAAVHARLAAVMEALVLAAVAELKKLLDARLGPELSVRPGAGGDSRETMVRKVGVAALAASFLSFLLFKWSSGQMQPEQPEGGPAAACLGKVTPLWRLMSAASIRCSLLPSWRRWGTKLWER